MIRSLAICLETIGICAILLGVSIEVYYEAAIGFIALTVGAGIIALGSMLWAKVCNR